MTEETKTTHGDKFGELLSVGRDYRYGGMDFRVSTQSLTREELDQLIVMTHYALKTVTDQWNRENEPQAYQAAP